MMAGAAQRPPFDNIEAARQQNLAKIQHLRQTLEAAQQQELQYKSQLEVSRDWSVLLESENVITPCTFVFVNWNVGCNMCNGGLDEGA